MSPIPMAARDQSVGKPPPILSLPPMDVPRELAREIVVDWQLPTDMERKG